MGEQISIYQVIDERGKTLLQQEVAVLEKLKDLIQQIAPQEPALATLEEMLAHIEELFLLVIVGEVKAGKSTFVNTLFGKLICKEGVTPVTDKIHILRYGASEEIEEIEPYVVEHRYPFEPLRNLNVVDTPGTNSLILEHQQITEKFIPRCDLALFITSIDRPFTESERQLLEYIKDAWGKKIVFVLSKIDMKQPAEVEEVLAFIKENCKRLLQFDPLIFPVSCKQAFTSKQNNDQESWRQSRFAEIENYIFQVLSQSERLKLKLSGPLFTGLKIGEKLLAENSKSQQRIELDLDVIDELDKIINYEERMIKKNYLGQVDKIDMVLRDLERWGRDYFEDNVRLANISLILKRRSSSVIANNHKLAPIPKLIEQNMEKALEKLFIATRSLWDQVHEILAKKLKTRLDWESQVEKSKVNDVDSEGIVKEMRQTIRTRLADLDMAGQCQAILQQSYKMLLVGTTGVLLALLLGIALNILTKTALFNGLGILLIFAGIFVLARFIPRQKKRAEQQFMEHLRQLGEDLRGYMQSYYQKEYDAIVKPLRNSIDDKKQRLEQQQQEQEQAKARIEQVKQAILALQGEIDELAE